jgi:hypothetical protein
MQPLTSNSCHSGAPRSGEPGIHNPGLWLWIPGSRPPGRREAPIRVASPRNDSPLDSDLELQD